MRNSIFELILKSGIGSLKLIEKHLRELLKLQIQMNASNELTKCF